MEEQKKIKIRGIIIFIFVACAVFAAAFFVSKIQKLPSIQEQNGIEVIEQSDQKIVRNIAEGYQVTVPREWIMEDIRETKKLIFHSPETLQQDIPGQIEHGCKIETHVSFEKTTLEKLQQDTKENLEWYTVKKNEYSIINVSNLKAVKNIFESEEMGYSTGVYVPTEIKLFSFILYSSEKDLEKCLIYFDNFIKNISIK